MAVIKEDGACAAIIHLKYEKELDKNNNLIIQNIELYPRATVFYTRARARTRRFVITYFKVLDGLGLPCAFVF